MKKTPGANLSRKIREIYQARPYPPVSRSRRRPQPVWRLAPMDWIEAISNQQRSEPQRILIAGCGSGNEAFALRDRFPHAEIVAVDFSPRSIRLAQQLQKKFPARRAIEFIVADLTSRQFGKNLGDKFDFISCHGVLSYVVEPHRGLQNLAGRLTDDGTLYLGVNGIRHHSENWRPVLERFGFVPTRFQDSRRLRRALRLFDAMAGNSTPLMAKMPAGYLAGDLFGPFIMNRTLEDWIALSEQCGLDFRGSYLAHLNLCRALNCDLYDLLLPRSRAEAHRITEQISPSTFHHMVFAHKAAPSPWESRAKLLGTRVRSNRIYKLRWPRAQTERGWQAVRLTSATTNTLVDLQLPTWTAQILRGGNIEQPLRDRLTRSRRVSTVSLRKHLYLLELLAAINVCAPA